MHNLARASIDDVKCSGALWRGVQGTHGEPGGGGADRSDEKKGAKPLAEGEALQRAKNSFPGEYFIPTFAEVQQQERKKRRGKKKFAG